MRKIAWAVLFAFGANVGSLALVTTSGAIVREETLVFVAEPLSETGIDINGDQNLTPGDGWISNAALTQSGEVVGRLVSSCQYAQVRSDGMGGVLQCVSTAKVPGGQITSQVRFVLVEGKTTGSVAAITGGTGEYANVRGVVVGEAIEGSAKSRISFHLIP